jgi:hypothetical protein
MRGRYRVPGGGSDTPMTIAPLVGMDAQALRQVAERAPLSLRGSNAIFVDDPARSTRGGNVR